MARWTFVVGICLLACLPTPLQAQRRADFSGKWVLVDSRDRGVYGSSFTVVQDAATLSIDTVTSLTRLTYNLSGETRVTQPEGAPPPAGFNGLRTTPYASLTRTGWINAGLVIVTHTMIRVTATGQNPPVAEIEQTMRHALAFDGTGQLVVERLIVADPAPWDTTSISGPPSSWRSIYKKAS